MIPQGYHWRDTDPREHFDKRGSIVVLMDGVTALRALVDTKHTYAVMFTVPQWAPKDFARPHVGPDDPWPQGLIWIPVPEVR